MGAIFSSGGGGGGGGQQASAPVAAPRRAAPFGPQLAPGQPAPGQPVKVETEEERRQRLLAAQARDQTILGPTPEMWGGGDSGGTGNSSGDGGGSGNAP